MKTAAEMRYRAEKNFRALQNNFIDVVVSATNTRIGECVSNGEFEFDLKPDRTRPDFLDDYFYSRLIDYYQSLEYEIFFQNDETIKISWETKK